MYRARLENQVCERSIINNPGIVIRPHITPGNEYEGTQSGTEEYDGIQRNATEYGGTRRNTKEYNKNTKEHEGIQTNTTEYEEIRSITKEYYGIRENKTESKEYAAYDGARMRTANGEALMSGMVCEHPTETYANKTGTTLESKEYEAVRRTTKEHDRIQRNTKECRGIKRIQRSTKEY